MSNSNSSRANRKFERMMMTIPKVVDLEINTSEPSVTKWLEEWDQALKNNKPSEVEAPILYLTLPISGERVKLTAISVDDVIIYENGKSYPPMTQEQLDIHIENIKNGNFGELDHPDKLKNIRYI